MAKIQERPGKKALAALVRTRKPRALLFKDDGETPNNPKLPLLFYRGPVALPDKYDPAAVFENLFLAHGWRMAWRDSIYDFLHFHTRTHEVLGIARGDARVEFGGRKGKLLYVKAGDVVVLPAGTGHKRLSKSRDLLVVGAYPGKGAYDEPKPGDVDHDTAKARIAKVKMPAQDPIYGKNGPLKRLWNPST